jgi:hypothetical protein
MPNASIGVSAGPLRVSQGLGMGCGLIGTLLAAPGVVTVVVILAILGHFTADTMTTFEGSGTFEAAGYGRDRITPGTWQGNTRLCKATVNGTTTHATFTVEKGETVTTQWACTWTLVSA